MTYGRWRSYAFEAAIGGWTNARPFLALGYVGNGELTPFTWKGHRICALRGETVSLEGGSEESLWLNDQGGMPVGHGTRIPESSEGMVERKGVSGKLGVGMGRNREQSSKGMSGQKPSGAYFGKWQKKTEMWGACQLPPGALEKRPVCADTVKRHGNQSQMIFAIFGQSVIWDLCLGHQVSY